MLRYRNTDSSIDMLEFVLRRSEAQHFDYGTAMSLIEIGHTYYVLGNLQKSIACFDSALPYCYKCSDYHKTIFPYLYLEEARCYTNQGDYQAANDCIDKAMKLITKNNLEDSFKMNLDFSLGLFSWSLNQYDRALAYFDESQKIAENKTDTIINMLSIINKGEIYIQKGDLQKAYPCIVQAEYLSQRDGYLIIQQMALSDLGDIYSRQNLPGQAIVYYKRAISLFKNQGLSPDHLHLISYYSLASAYYKINDLSNAKKILYPLVTKAQKQSIDLELGNGLALLGDINAKEGRYKEATKWFQEYIDHESRILDKKNTDNINKLELKYRISEKDKQLAQKQLLLSEKEVQLKNKNIWILGSFSLFLLLFILFISIIISSKQKQKIKQLNATIDGEEHERTRIARELHDGVMIQFSTVKMNLSTLISGDSHQSDTQDIEKVMQHLDSATRELRRTAHNLMPDVLLEEGLSDAVYFFCKGLQQSTGLTINCQIYGQIPKLKQDFELSVYRIIQELIHNVIKHAHATQAIVQISGQATLLMITVEDDGIGISEEDMKKKGSAGLKNIQSRIKVLKGHIDIKGNKGSGTTVYIEFDMRKLVTKNAPEVCV